MKYIIAVLFLMLSWCGYAQDNKVWTVNDLPMPYLQDSTQHVCNPEHILSPAIVDSVNVLLTQVERKRGVQAIVVVVNRVPNGDAYRFGMDVAKHYGIGSKEQRSGLLIVLAVADRNYYILTGNGLEGTLPDAICNRVERKVMLPYLKQGNWNQAIWGTVKALSQYIFEDTQLKNMKKDDAGEGVIKYVILLVFIFVIFMLSTKQKRKCPVCHRKTLKNIKRKYIQKNGKTYLRTYWKCSSCGYEEYKDDELPPDDHGRRIGRSGLPFIFLGSAMGRGGSFGGGSFGGGSFGGGSFGGGGSGGSF